MRLNQQLTSIDSWLQSAAGLDQQMTRFARRIRRSCVSLGSWPQSAAGPNEQPVSGAAQNQVGNELIFS